MSIARRTLLTTTAAGTLLCALWFVPSANATDGAAPQGGSAGSSAPGREAYGARAIAAQETLAETGSGVDTTPYLIGGTAFLCAGAGFVAYSVRRGTVSPGF